MLRCGLLGEKLGHSYSPAIHAMLGDYAYQLYERRESELDALRRDPGWDGLNVTIPYKKTVLPWCDELSDTAARIGSVNTLVRRDGRIYGDNTDAYGFRLLLARSGLDPRGKKALVLGSGGASAMVCQVLRDLGVGELRVISRTGEDSYATLDRHGDARLIVNTTPLGMYPKNGAAAVDLRDFPRCEAVLDLVYNPARTALLLQAEALGVPHAGGLTMLVAQAKRSAELFTGEAIDDGAIERIEKRLRAEMENIILIGMPGCGKSTVAAALGAALERPVHEADALVAQEAGRSIPDIFRKEGEAGFRRRETRALEALGKLSGTVLSTGGGCVTREENYPLLRQNGRILWLKRDLDRLPTAGRPISQSRDLTELYAERAPLYERFADAVVDNNGSLEDTLRQIREVLA